MAFEQSRAESVASANGFAQVLVLTSLATISAIITVTLVNGTRSGAYSVALDRQVRGEIAT